MINLALSIVSLPNHRRGHKILMPNCVVSVADAGFMSPALCRATLSLSVY